jgi:hypothetical protein
LLATNESGDYSKSPFSSHHKLLHPRLYQIVGQYDGRRQTLSRQYSSHESNQRVSSLDMRYLVVMTVLSLSRGLPFRCPRSQGPRHDLALKSTTSKTSIISPRSGELWVANMDCWRPTINDVERISWGKPAKNKGTGSRGVPHRLNDEERFLFDQARRKGFLEINASGWRKQRRDAPLLNRR